MAQIEIHSLSLTGEDVRDWIQGQITQDIGKVKDHPVRVHTLLCKPTGQILAQAALHWVDENTLNIETPQPEPFIERVETYVVTEDVAIQDLGSATATRVTLFPNGFSTQDGGNLVWEAFQAGIPIVGLDTSPTTLPLDLNPAYYQATVSTEKGCYVGQEIIQRMETRGHANWQWVALEDFANEPGQEKIKFMRFIKPGLASVYVPVEQAIEGLKINGAKVRLFPIPASS